MKENNKINNNDIYKLIPYILLGFLMIMLIIGYFLFSQPKEITMDKIELEASKEKLQYGENSKINILHFPKDKTDQKIIWTSNNPEHISVDEEGNVKVNKNEAGTVIITAKTEDGTIEENITLTIEKVDDITHVSNISLNREEITLNYGESFQLLPTITPDNANNKNVTWTSNNNELVSVNKTGFVTVNKNEAGEAIITVKTDDGNYTAKAKVTTVKVETPVKVTGISLNKNELSLKKGDTYQLTATITPDNATNKNVIWASSNTSLVSVNQNGLIKVNQNVDGDVTITAKTRDGQYSAKAKVTIKKVSESIKVTSIELDKKEITLKYGETAKLTEIIKPTNATNKTVTWTSSNKELVSVDQNGKLTVNKNETGTVTITVKTKDNSKTATATINVIKENAPVKVTGISLNKSNENLLLNNVNKTTILQATVYPEDAENKNILWSSNDPEIATVENGVVTAKKIGTVTITATTEDGAKKATATINVKKNVIIVLGASQVTRMKKYKTEYTSKQNNNYKVSDNTLIYVEKSGSLIIYQTQDGYDIAVKHINNIASSKKEYVNFYVFFPLVGNTIKRYSCDELTTTNTKMTDYVNNYNNSIKKIIDNGYQAKGYIVSMHPLKVSQSESSTVVVNQNKNSCAASYRSNRKYYYFNNVIQELTNQINPKYVRYIETFTEIMEVADKDKNYSYKITYNTDDGVHWNEETTKMYVDMMFNLTNDL